MLRVRFRKKTRASRTTGARGINFLASSNKYQIQNNTETSPSYARVAAMINKQLRNTLETLMKHFENNFEPLLKHFRNTDETSLKHW